MKKPLSVGLVAGAIAVTAGGGVSIVADGWPEADLIGLRMDAEDTLKPRFQ